MERSKFSDKDQKHLANMPFSTFTEQIKELTTTKAKAKAYEKKLKWLTLVHSYKSDLAMQKVFKYLKGEKCATRLRFYIEGHALDKWKKRTDRELTRRDWLHFYYELIPRSRVRNFIIQNEKAIQARALLAANNIKKHEDFIPNFNFLFDSLDLVTQPILDLANPAYAYPDPKPEEEEAEEEKHETQAEVLYEEKHASPAKVVIREAGVLPVETKEPPTPRREHKSKRETSEDPRHRRSPSRRSKRDSESDEESAARRRKKHAQKQLAVEPSGSEVESEQVIFPPNESEPNIESEPEPKPAPAQEPEREPEPTPKPKPVEIELPVKQAPEQQKASGTNLWIFVLIFVGIGVAIALVFAGKHMQLLKQEMQLQNELLKHTENKARNGRNVFYVRP